MRSLRIGMSCIALAGGLVVCARAANAAPRCPESVLGSLDGKTYAVVFSADGPYAGVVDATLYTATRTYGAQFAIGLNATGKGAKFVSAPLALVDPADEPFEAAELHFDGEPATCTERRQVAPPKSDRAISDALASVDPAQHIIPIVRVIASTSTLTCEHGYVAARIDGNPATVMYPAIAREQDQTGTVSIRLALDAAGKITDASVFRSSGYASLDAEGLRAATHTRYLPQIFRSEPVSGAYLFRAGFSN